jgi:hypothetical protein
VDDTLDSIRARNLSKLTKKEAISLLSDLENAIRRDLAETPRYERFVEE